MPDRGPDPCPTFRGVAAEPLPPAGSKTAKDENFPVASRFLPAHTRGAVLSLYRFARLADDVADSRELTPRAKLAALDAADAMLLGTGDRGLGALEDGPLLTAARELRSVCREANVPVEHARHLLQAFRKDAVQNRYETWSELLAYCHFSAAPVGRFLLALHGEDRKAWPCADALCNAHQILNHVQDCKADFLRLGRIYLPMRWLREAGATAGMVGADAAHPALRRTLDRVLTGAGQLLDAARPLPTMLRNRGLRIQAAATLSAADLLLLRLRRQDPLAAAVRIGPIAKARCAISGLARGWAAPADG